MELAAGRAKRRSRASVRAIATVGAGLSLLFACAGQAHAAAPTWERAWGEDVVTGGGTGAEICTVAAECKAGLSTGGLGGELNAPRGIAIGPDGDVYVTEDARNRVQKFDADGNFERAWGKDVVTGGGTGFEICTVAADCKTGVAGGLGGELNSPFGVAVDATGNVYVVDQLNNRIQRFDSDGNFQRTWGKNVSISSGDPNFEICTIALDCKAGDTGSLGGDLSSPRAVAADAAGNVYVVDIGNGRIQKYNSSGVFQRAWGRDVVTGGGTGAEICTVQAACKSGVIGSLGGELNNPRTVATDGDAVYVPEAGNFRIDKFDPSGNFERAWGKDVVTGGGTGAEICTVAADCKPGSSGGLGGELNDVLGIGIDAAGDVHAADADNDRVQQFDADGNFLRAWGRDVVTGGGTGYEVCTAAAECKAGVNGSAGGELSTPTGVASDGADHVYVTDRSNHRVQSFSFDTTPPDTQIDSGPDDPTNDPTPTFTFSSPDDPGSTFECQIDGGGWSACGSPHTTAPLVDGFRTFEVRAIDAVGNVDPSPATATFTLDTDAPDTILLSGPDELTNDTAPTFTFDTNEPGSTFECRVDTAAFAPCTSPHTTAGLDEGEHAFEVRAIDEAGNVDPSPASNTFVVDVTPPDTQIDSGPDDPGNDDTPTFTFSSPDGGIDFECRVDGGGFSPCTSPHTTASLADGERTFEVRAADAAGNVDPSPASDTFEVDATPPTTTIDSGPGGPTSNTTPIFTFSADESSEFECRVDAAAFAPCISPFVADPLGEGQHSFEVRATDVAGNTDPAPPSRDFTVDLTPPGTQIDSGPRDLSNDTTPTFTFSADEGGSSFACRVDAESFAPCASPHTTDPLGEGEHTFEVRATDAAGNTDPDAATQTFTLDLTPPDTQIDSGPSGATDDSTPTFAFSSPDAGATFECQLKGAGFKPCNSPHTTAALADGPYTFEVRATDAAGNTDHTPASRGFTLDTTSEPPPSGGGGGPKPDIDTTPPVAVLDAKSKQKAGAAIKVEVGCDEDCTASATGTATAKRGKARRSAAGAAKKMGKFKLAPASAEIPAGHSATLTLKPKGKAKKGLKKAVKGGAKAKAQIGVEFVDRAGNSTEDSLVVKLK